MTVRQARNAELLAEIGWRGRAAQELTPDDWADLLGQARSCLLLARLAVMLQRGQGWAQVPARPLAYLSTALEVVAGQQVRLQWELAQIQAALRGLELPVLLLKGGAYVATGLPPAAGRSMSDIDLMVQADRIGEVENALFRAGWISQERDAYNQRYYRQWMHEVPPLMHVKRGTVIDLHHTITAPTSSFAVDGGKLLATSRPIDAANPQWRVLQPVDMVLHSAVHLFQEGEFDHGLRDLLDMDWLLQHFAMTEHGFWGQLLARAGELRLQVPLHHALHHIERLFGARVPDAQRSAVQALAPAWPQRALMAWLLTRALRPQHPSAAQGGEGLARSLLYLRSHWLRMPMHLLVPHLLRKAWMRQLPQQKDAQDAR